MADTKISALPASTTPLAGTEVLPIVQSGATKQVSVANLTAGRAISATSVTASTGNFVVGTSGQGIDFSSTPGTGTSELLNDYEEGTFTPVILFGGGNTGMTYGSQIGRYTKIGNRVYFSIYIFPTNKGSSTGAVTISGLPFTSEGTAGNASAVSVFLQTFTFGVSTNPTARIVPSATAVQMYFMNLGTQATMLDTQVNVSSEFSVTGFYQV
jgi:hypothetical protein